MLRPRSFPRAKIPLRLFAVKRHFLREFAVEPLAASQELHLPEESNDCVHPSLLGLLQHAANRRHHVFELILPVKDESFTNRLSGTEGFDGID